MRIQRLVVVFDSEKEMNDTIDLASERGVYVEFVEPYDDDERWLADISVEGVDDVGEIQKILVEANKKGGEK